MVEFLYFLYYVYLHYQNTSGAGRLPAIPVVLLLNKQIVCQKGFDAFLSFPTDTLSVAPHVKNKKTKTQMSSFIE